MNVELLKQGLASAGACIITMLGFWLGHLRNLPDREEVKRVVHESVQAAAAENPYLQDRALMLHRLNTLTETTKELDHSVRELNSRLDRLPAGKAAPAPGAVNPTAIAKP